MYQAFSPKGPTVLVDTTPRQADPLTNANPQQATAYRIRNLGNADAWIGWMPAQTNNATPASFTASAPAAGASQLVLGLGGKQTEVFAGLPANAWFVASSGATFEVTPGEGI